MAGPGMPEKYRDFRREARDTIVKSGLTGVAATVLAVTLSSPAGLGGMVGTSLASGAVDPNAASDAYANLPPYPAPLTAAEVSEIRGQLAATAASLALTRAATDDVIAHMRTIASNSRGTTAPQAATVTPSLRVAFTEVEESAAAPVSYAPVAEEADPNLELATLLFSYDSL